ISQVSVPDLAGWKSLGELTPEEKANMESYLKVPLSAVDKKLFQSFLAGAVINAGSDESYFGRIMAILKSFGTYQYQLGFTDDVSVAHLVNFLTSTKNGDCTEFSNTAALLGRLAGIPSRVVTGYLASHSLQTPAHVRGLYVLQQSIPELQKYSLDDLMLVTTAHRHSWVQYYLPSYGWVDFESTAYAIPPPANMNPNNQTVIIPLIQPQKELAPVFQFPWLLVLQILMLLAVAVVVLLYLYRYGREAALALLARRGGKRGAWALYRVLLMRLAAAGYHLKPPTRTPLEYSESHPEIREFAAAYTRLRYRDQATDEEQSQMWSQLRQDYAAAIRVTKKSGLKEWLRRIFSLRGLYY
ncbi:MAG TPA: transglutaminase domain-containing protein, partial [Spirochaetia bacterium]|nr:transglutaminase domain-containing protein [Spirochaetia bacterium]